MVSLGLIAMVLLQAGKGASLSNLFGGGPGEAILGSGGDTFLKKITVAFAIIFMITSLSLYIISARQEIRSVVNESGRPTTPTSAPVPTPPQPAGQNQPAPAQPGKAK